MYKKKKEISGHGGAIYASACDSQFIYSGSADKYVARWFQNEGTQDSFSIKMDHSVYQLELLNLNKHLIVGLSNGSLHIFDLELRKELKHFIQHIKPIFSITSNLHTSQFYVGDADGNFSVWDSNTFELLLYLPLDCGKIRNICISADGTLVVLSCQDGTTRIFETISFNEIITLDSHLGGATIAHFHALDSAILLTAGKDALLKVWDWKSATEIKSIPAHNYVIYDIVFFENGEKFGTASRDKSIKIWDSKRFDVLQKIDFKVGGHRHSVNALVKLTENSFCSVGDDKKIMIWENQEG